MRDPKITGEEYDWLGPIDEEKHIVFKMQSSSCEKWWLMSADGLTLDDHSEFSVRIHDPKLRSLSLILRTIAIIPKSKLRSIYNLIGRYLDDHDNSKNDV